MVRQVAFVIIFPEITMVKCDIACRKFIEIFFEKTSGEYHQHYVTLIQTTMINFAAYGPVYQIGQLAFHKCKRICCNRYVQFC